jgi:hypothetical protein
VARATTLSITLRNLNATIDLDSGGHINDRVHLPGRLQGL